MDFVGQKDVMLIKLIIYMVAGVKQQLCRVVAIRYYYYYYVEPAVENCL